MSGSERPATPFAAPAAKPTPASSRCTATLSSAANLPEFVSDETWAYTVIYGQPFGGDLPHLKARKDLPDDFKRKMLYDNPVRFYRFSEGDIAAARKAKGN
jgi:hypothetical protein